ncbi:hypothetical protein [Agathobacter rectalis]|jgi:hypothetical protein|uniref:hypothetical protein n=2 Tax=Agathobacter rectalis TaxID=39491 RepID=UPI0027D2330F|nr:hypothetical protein [Agathobacter rectalis]MCG4812219.1 hypothetical protein [Agathobacter rectalis]
MKGKIMSPQEFIFRHNLINFLDDGVYTVKLNDKNIDDLIVEDENNNLKVNVNLKENYQDFLQSSKSESEYFISVYDSTEYQMNSLLEEANLER